jgi:hypothetical protein
MLDGLDMCLMLYIGAAEELPLEASDDLRVENVDEARRVVTRWFSQPTVRFVGAHTGCSCGFPSVIGESRIDYFEGMSFPSDNRAADLRSVHALMGLIRRALASSGSVELYPVADGSEGSPPKGVIDWSIDSIEPERFFFNEQFKYVVRNGAAG